MQMTKWSFELNGVKLCRSFMNKNYIHKIPSQARSKSRCPRRGKGRCWMLLSLTKLAIHPQPKCPHLLTLPILFQILLLFHPLRQDVSWISEGAGWCERVSWPGGRVHLRQIWGKAAMILRQPRYLKRTEVILVTLGKSHHLAAPEAMLTMDYKIYFSII